MLKTPILFLIFNRPDLTKIVFEKIRENKPNRLYVAADGPRANRPQEEYLCEESRKIIEKVDWDCEVKTLFRETNLGLKIAVSSAIDWFFENEEEGIILEDDCYPSNSFFGFCEELLDYYRDDTQIMHITGNNLINLESDHSYYFAKIEFCWGWATWKRAWKKFDVNMSDFLQFLETRQIDNVFEKEHQKNYWLQQWNRVYQGKINSWAYIWTYTIIKENGICINPVKNMVNNIGFRDDSTHTIDSNSSYANKSVFEIDKIIHPKFKLINKELTERILKEVFFIKEPSSEQCL